MSAPAEPKLDTPTAEQLAEATGLTPKCELFLPSNDGTEAPCENAAAWVMKVKCPGCGEVEQHLACQECRDQLGDGPPVLEWRRL